MSSRKKSTARARSAGAKGVAPESGVLFSRIGLLLAVALWVFLTASLLGYDPADPPGHAVVPINDPVANWCGPVGAMLAHYTKSLLGVGSWILLLAAGLAIALKATGRSVNQPILRTIGVMMVAMAISAMQALIAPASGPMPEGSGGLVAIAGVTRLSASFNTFGAGLWILLIAIVGAIVAFDRWLFIVPARLLGLAGPAVASSGAGMSSFLASRAEARRAKRVRANDVDDDERPSRTMKRNVRNAERIEIQAVAVDDEPIPAPTRKHKANAEPRAAEPDVDDEPELEDAIDRDEQDDEEDLPGAPQVFDADQLRAKIAKLPVRFAGMTRRAATDEDLADLQNHSEMEGYAFPTLDLLEDPEESYSEKMESFVRAQATALEEALRVYRIDGEVVGIDSGPVITLYEVRLAPGTKVSQLNAISSDLARALKAINIRIVSNMVGRDTVGVEVPNAHKEKVRLKELMNTSEKQVARMRLPMFLGKDASGEPLIEDLAEMPHMLIAGTTGSGKSVCMNTIIMSFLYTKKPNELKMVLIDPKMVELSMFRDIPHLMCPVVTEMSKAAAILEWAVQKMDERYELLAEAGVRDIAGYNDLEWEDLKERFNPQSESEAARIPRKLPYIVFMIDELADLMMTHKEVEGAIVRVAQKARAVGLHLILATQRPQANVVTGLIKSNMPARVAFKVASGMDSRIVLDQKGGELLLGQGDMLFLSPRSHKLTRAQGTLVEDREARKIVRFLKDVASPSFERQLVQLRSTDPEANNDGLANAQEDPLFDKAVEIVLETKRGSVSLLQRRLAIGYTRASRLIDLMGEAGIIGEYKGTVAREVSITPEMWEAMKAQAAQDAQEQESTEMAPAETATATAVGEAPFDAESSLFPEPKSPRNGASSVESIGDDDMAPAPQGAIEDEDLEYIYGDDDDVDEDDEDDDLDDEDEEEDFDPDEEDEDEEDEEEVEDTEEEGEEDDEYEYEYEYEEADDDEEGEWEDEEGGEEEEWEEEEEEADGKE